MYEFSIAINAGSQTEAPALENTVQHKMHEFLVAYSWVHALVKKALYRFITLDLPQVRFVFRLFWMRISVCCTNKEIFKQPSVLKSLVYRHRRKWWVTFLLSVMISDARELFVKRCVALPICVFYHLIIEKARTPLL